MEISLICPDFIKILNSGKTSIKSYQEKTEKIDSFCKILKQDEIRQEFIKSTYIVDTIQAVLKMSMIATLQNNFKYAIFANVPSFFTFFATYNIPFANEEKETQSLIDTITEIITKQVAQADNDYWIFWLKIFTEIFKIPTFYNFFREKNNESDADSISYIPVDNLFNLMNDLMKYEKIKNENLYANQRSLALVLFSTFLANSPYPPSASMIKSMFDASNSFAEIDLPINDFENLLSILNKLIAMSPISFIINSTTPFQAPFNEKILKTIFEKWKEYQTSFSIRKSVSSYLLLFLTTMDAFEYKMEQTFYDSWGKRILESWSMSQNKGKFLKSHKDIPYLRSDVEFFKRSNDKSISKCLLHFVISKNNHFNLNCNIIWLFTAIGLYAPNVVHDEDWLQILRSISISNLSKAIWQDQEMLPDFLNLISVMVDVIESRTEWNKVFSFLMENKPSNESISLFYSLISKILANQKVDVKTVHQYQDRILDSSSKFSIERLQSIHTLIYYYGFADEISRTSCFETLISLLDTNEVLTNDFLKQLALTIVSVISSHPCSLVPIKEEKIKEKSIDDVCNKLKKQLEITTLKKKIETPLQTEELFLITPDSSQIIVDDNDNTDEQLKESHSSKNLEKENQDKKQQFALCNYITKQKQSNFVKIICHKKIENETNDCYFRLFLTSLMPNFFSPNEYFDKFKLSFNTNCNISSFHVFFKILLTLTEEIQSEDFQQLFDEIETFFEIGKNYVQSYAEKIQEFLQDRSTIWSYLNDSELENNLYDLVLFSEFAVKCSNLANEANDHFYCCFQDILSTTVMIPNVHLKICSNLLKLSLSKQQKYEIISSLGAVTVQVLNVLLVPIKERDEFIDELFNGLIFENSTVMGDLIAIISNYSITPSMKLNLLNVMQNHYRNANNIFDCLWATGIHSPFFIRDEYPMIRLQSIDTIISILKMKDIIFGDGDEITPQKFEKGAFYKEFICPSIEEILNTTDWSNSKQTVFTAIKTLILIAAEIPELTKKALYMIFESFTIHDYSIFPNKCINILFSGLSSRIHFSLFLRQFIPMMIPQLDKLIDSLAVYPYKLFFYDKNDLNEPKRMFCEMAAPYAISFAVANSKEKLIEFFTSALKKTKKEIIIENGPYICSYLLDAIAESTDEETQTNLRNYYQSFKQGDFMSPIPLLSFVTMASEDAIISSYQTILEEKSYTQEFVDIRNFIFKLYRNIFKAHHELVQSYYLQQFTLYASILFNFHKQDFETKQTLFSDILALTVNLLEFVPPSESSNLLNAISSNIPDSFDMNMVGFVKNIEDICINLGYHQCLDRFFEKFPQLINEILIFDFLKEQQLEIRTPMMEFNRIAKTRRLNQNSIDFLLTNFTENAESIEPINELSNDTKRVVLNLIYQFAIFNPQTLALHLYSEMFLNFIHIHPSPMIIESNIKAPILLFMKILELARDKNPSISRSALTSLHLLINKNNIPLVVKKDKFLMNQISQYKDYARPRKKVKKPDDDSPWVCKFSCKYIEQMKDDQSCSAFGSLAAASPDFCRQIFPHLFIECLTSPLADSIYDEFKQYAKDPLIYFEECKLFISAFNYIRAVIFSQEHTNTNKWHINWCKRNIDFDLIMDVCLKIGDPFSAYQYAEFAREASCMGDEPLNRIFTHLGVNDLKYGLNLDFSNPLSVAELHTQERRFEKALILYDNGNNGQKMCNALNSLHLYNLLNNTSISEKNIESLWRLQKWNVSSEIMREMNPKDHSSCLFSVMQAFASNNEEAVNQKMNDFAQQFHFDLSSSVFTQLSYLLDASALQWFHAVSFPESSKLSALFPQSIDNLYHRSLNKLNQLSHQFYSITESTNALHGVFFCILNEFNDEIQQTTIPAFFSDVITNALENKDIESAQYFISLLRENQKKIPQFANFEQIRVLYADNSQRAASLLNKNYDHIILQENQLNLEELRNVFNLSVEFTRASWSSSTNNLPSDKVFEQLRSVIAKCEPLELLDLMADAEFTMARIYHRQHREICDFYMSAEYRTIVEILKYEREYLKQKVQTTERTTLRTTKQDYQNYIEIITRYKEMFATTIVSAIENYMCTLSHTNKYDLECTFSIIGLWFDYSYTKYKPLIQEIPNLIPIMEDVFPEIDPNKFLLLFYQLAARIEDLNEITATQNDEYNTLFQNFLRRIVISICQKNPNECFPILFALEMTNEKNAKIESIQEMIVSITNMSPELSQRWQQMKFLLKSYLRVGSGPKINDKNKAELDSNLLECTSTKKKYLTIITNPKEVGIDSFEKEAQVLSGVTKPLLLRIRGTDGRIYKQVLKYHKDDLRQDAVVQQLFVLSSKLLSRRNPNLSIRHYKVVPISLTTGVIEFVQGSMSIQEYFNSAYFRYLNAKERDDIIRGFKEFKDVSTNYHSNVKTPTSRNELIKFFVNFQKRINPVFHFFFIEKFPNPGDWFVSRLRYSRHTATNSMVGHIFGIGDRHLNNIMIDEKTGEIIHIDLGIAFDQGKALPISELVPFRLTKEIVDGMGWMGKDGIFRKTCEESMTVLRNNSEYLLTILNVFISDPLYTWNLVLKNQKEMLDNKIANDIRNREQNKNKIAESVIVTCRRKLEGRETGENLSVEGQVSKLINDSTSAENLALMYCGWKPYL